jgi:hypothetical protein
VACDARRSSGHPFPARSSAPGRDRNARGSNAIAGVGGLTYSERVARNGWTRDRLFKLMKELGVQPYPLKAGGDIATDFNVAFVARE